MSFQVWTKAVAKQPIKKNVIWGGGGGDILCNTAVPKWSDEYVILRYERVRIPILTKQSRFIYRIYFTLVQIFFFFAKHFS